MERGAIMTADVRRPAFRWQPWSGFSAGAFAMVTIPLLFAAAVAGADPRWHRLLFAVAVTANLIVLAVRSPRVAIFATLAVWLPLLALFRRLLIFSSGWTVYDPLLLVAPLVVLFLILQLFVKERRLLLSDRLSKLVLALLVVAILETANPLGGGPIVGAGGLLFVGIPLLWFFIGRELATRRFVRNLMLAIAGLAVLIGAYGLAQTQIGFPIWDIAWIDSVDNYALLIGGETGVYRAFGPLSSFTEYALFLAAGMVFFLGFAFDRRLPFVLGVGLLSIPLFLASTRSTFALAVLAIMVMTAMWLFRPPRAALVAVLVGVVAAGAAFKVATPILSQASASSADPLVAHQAAGLADPLDERASTLPTHWRSFRDGVIAGVKRPLGQGTGATNRAADTLGGPGRTEVRVNEASVASVRGSDMDASNIFLSLGLAGGLLYLAIFAVAISRLVKRFLERRDPMVLAVIGFLIVSTGHWLDGHPYAAVALLWFMLGWATRREAPQEEETFEQVDPRGPGAVRPARAS